MGNLNLTQRTWQIADDVVQRALDQLANAFDAAAKKINTALDFTTDTLLTVRGSIIVAGSLSSSTGFKSVIGPWQRSSSTMPTTPMPLVWASDTAGTNASNLIQGFVATHSGSVIGMQLAGLMTSTTNVTVTVYKNNAPTAATFTGSLISVNSYAYTTFPKGTAAFAPGDRLDMYHSAAAANTGQIVSSFTVEMTA